MSMANLLAGCSSIVDVSSTQFPPPEQNAGMLHQLELSYYLGSLFLLINAGEAGVVRGKRFSVSIGGY